MQSIFKPYQFVLVKVADPFVEMKQRTFIGETMSMPTPDATIMVRRVVGHPGTLIEVPVASLTLQKGMNRCWVHYARVNGVRPNGLGFATDMLRYDTCVPVNFTYGRTSDFNPNAKIIEIDPAFGWAFPVVAQASRSMRPQWTVERWHSFFNSIVPLKTEYYPYGGALPAK